MYIGAIDSGTTSTRFALFDRRGAMIRFAQESHQQVFPQHGWVEHDASEIWKNTQTVIRRVLDQPGVDAGDILAVGVTNQRETTVVWDPATGQPIHPAIVWQDLRTDAICKSLDEQGKRELIVRKSGLPVATYFSGPKVRWILDQVSGARPLAEQGKLMFGTIDSWLIWNLTGGRDGGRHVTDPTNASRTLLMNLDTCQWDGELLDLMEVPASILPEIKPSSDRIAFGSTAKTGPFGRSIPITGNLGDQQAALFGQCCFAAGEAKNTYGTGCFLLTNTGTERVYSQNGLLTTIAYQLADEPTVFALEGSINMAGATLQWLRDDLNLIDNVAETEAVAQTVPDSGGCYLVPAFSGLYAPHWRSDARGVIVGLTRFVNRAHVVRAALESICYQTREVLDAMNSDSGVALKSLRVDGGATANNFLMQLQADFLGVEVIRPVVAETTSLGVAYAAGLAVGFWPDVQSLRENWQVDRTWIPSISAEQRKAGYQGWTKAVKRTLNWIDE